MLINIIQKLTRREAAMAEEKKAERKDGLQRVMIYQDSTGKQYASRPEAREAQKVIDRRSKVELFLVTQCAVARPDANRIAGIMIDLRNDILDALK
jgi:hypothetical protein